MSTSSLSVRPPLSFTQTKETQGMLGKKERYSVHGVICVTICTCTCMHIIMISVYIHVYTCIYRSTFFKLLKYMYMCVSVPSVRLLQKVGGSALTLRHGMPNLWLLSIKGS